MDRNKEISLMAYYIWLEERCCHGYDLDHWLKAEKMWEDQQKQNAAQEIAQKVKADTPVPVKKKARRLNN